MNVLMVNMTLDAAAGGGTATRTIQSCLALTTLGVRCTIATTTDGFGADSAAPDGVTVIRLPAVGGRLRIPTSGFDALREAASAADVMLIANHWTAMNIAAYRAARRTRMPYVVSPAGALPVTGRSRMAKTLYNSLYGRRIISNAAGHIAVTDDEALQFAPYGVAAERVTVIPNGMPAVSAGEAERFRAAHKLGTSPILLFLGRLAPIKGPDLLLEAFIGTTLARSSWRLVLAGPDDGMRADLERRAVDAGVGDRVHFTGFLSAVSKADALAACDLVVLPSRRESMSVVVLEAAAAGRAVLVNDTCGIPEVAQSGGGWVVPATAQGLAEGLNMATSDRAALVAAGLRWQRYASERYSWTRVAEAYMALFTRLAGGSEGRRSRRPAAGDD